MDGKAETIFQEVNKLLSEKGIDGRNLIAACTDGATVGCHPGVVQKLRQEYNSELAGVHCTAHRLPLSASDAAKPVLQVKKFQQDLRSIFKEPKLTFTQPHAVHWLSIHSAVSVVCRTVKSLSDILEHIAASNTQDSVKAKSLLNSVRQFNCVALCHLMLDVLMHIVLLSFFTSLAVRSNKLHDLQRQLIFKRESLDFSTVQPMTHGTKEAVKELTVNPGASEEEFFNSLEDNKFKGDKMFDCHTQKPAFDNVKSRYVSSLIDEIERHFPADAMNLLTWFSVLEPRRALAAKQPTEEEFSQYGQENLDRLLKHFATSVCAEVAASEFRDYGLK
ncbi:ZN862 protein, partial [Polyodon spathula]|nr:ZN862 protein [Polyodon spathula]